MTCEPWPITYGCEPEPPVDDEQRAAAIVAAQALLWARTGRRMGTCEVVERYRVPPGSSGCGVPWMGDDRIWHNGGRGGECCAIHLVSQPVQSITSVEIDGVPLDASGYELEGSVLRRIGACWPVVAACDEPVIQVSYNAGVSLTAPTSPWWGLAGLAMGEVAREIMSAMCGGPCRISSRAVSVTRQGVTVQMADPTDTREAGLLGTELADMFITAVNPGGRPMRSRVYSPDMAQLS